MLSKQKNKEKQWENSLHVDLADVAMAVLNDVSMLAAIKDGRRRPTALHLELVEDVLVGRIDGGGEEVNNNVHDQHDRCYLGRCQGLPYACKSNYL